LAALGPSAAVAQEEAGEKLSADDIRRLTKQLDDEDVYARCRAARELAKAGPAAKEAVPVLFGLLGNRSKLVRDAALDAIEAIGVRVTAEAGQQIMSAGNEFMSKDIASAERLYRLSMRTLEKVVEREPDNLEARTDLGATHLNIGNVLYSYRRRDRSRESYQECIRITRAVLEADPTHRVARYQLAKSHEALGKVYFGPDKTRAKKHYGRFAEGMRGLARDDPRNPRCLEQFSIALFKYGDACWWLGEEELALRCYVECAETLGKIPARSALRIKPTFGLSAAYGVMATDGFQKGRLREAAKLYGKAFKHLEALSLCGPKGRGSVPLSLIIPMALSFADVHILMGEFESAEEHVKRCKALLGQLGKTAFAPDEEKKLIGSLDWWSGQVGRLRALDTGSDDGKQSMAAVLEELGDRCMVSRRSTAGRRYLRKALELHGEPPQVETAKLRWKLMMACLATGAYHLGQKEQRDRSRRLLGEPLGIVAKEQEERDEAHRLLGEACEIAAALEGEAGVGQEILLDAALPFIALGSLREAEGKRSKARDAYLRALKIVERIEETGALNATCKGMRADLLKKMRSLDEGNVTKPDEEAGRPQRDPE
jgi:tetratricopeptide (TPR) repeat protein